ncbi:MAG TPA: nitrilase-related carbon-nitrogen hydrolase [Candidatus Limnocylindrales bacterium]|nr:nitrilase-related carbon-nitrogen hydrolase [Candidatus Limnocylindrales bacterium]
MPDPLLLTATGGTASPARVLPAARTAFRIGVVQLGWHEDPAKHEAAVASCVRLAARHGARLICLPELTLLPYFPIRPDADVSGAAEDIPGGPTCRLAQRLADETNAFVHASLFERAPDGGLGYDTAIVAGPGAGIVAQTRKLHIPRTAGYHEDRYFRPGPPDRAYPVIGIEQARFGFPTCWDQWFPELARAYALRGADVLVYPTAIGSEPDHPGFDTAPLWEQVIVANGIMNGTFMVAANRVGREGGLTFYGSSFVSDPYGRKLVQAPRDQPAVLVADLDLDQRRDWLDLFPFLGTRRPEAYGVLVEREATVPYSAR